MKNSVKSYLETQKYVVEDVGTYNIQSCDYPDIAAKVCQKVLSGECEKGIVLCGTGIGISIAANKIKGIRCALCHDHYTACMAVQHNNANVLAMGGRTTGIEVAKEIADAFLTEKPDPAPKHTQRITKLHSLEN
uniref:Ribose 5-phosphate isomerase B n=1 Tax=Arcella intermedia TaxID=1963864 RepID=A0A6B2LQ02_9EUKA